MKTHTLSIAAAWIVAAVSLSSCSAELDRPAPEDSPAATGTGSIAFTATVPPVVKTVLDGLSVKWTESDVISVNGTASSAVQLVDDGSRAIFTVPSVQAPYYAVYPVSCVVAGSFDPDAGNYASVSLPEVQTYVPDSFDPSAAVLTGRSDVEGDLQFSHAMTYLKFILHSSGTTDAIASVTITARGGEGLSGTWTLGSDGATLTPVTVSSSIRIDCGTGAPLGAGIIAAIPAGTYAQGLALEIIDVKGRRSKVVSGKSFSAVAGTLYPSEMTLSLYQTKVYGTKTWMVENCHESGSDGKLGVTYDISRVPTSKNYDNAGILQATLDRLNEVQGRYYTWYEAMTGISGATAEDCPYTFGYSGTDDAGAAFTLDGKEGEYGVQLRGCCPAGWHIANCNDWWDLLVSIKKEYNVPDDDFVNCAYNYSYGHSKDVSTALTKARFYSVAGATNIKQFGNAGAWLMGDSGREEDGGVWYQSSLTGADAGETLNIFTSRASDVGFNLYPLSYFDCRTNQNRFMPGNFGRYGYVWTPATVSASVTGCARVWSVTGCNLNTFMLLNANRSDTNKSNRANVRCVKNY